MCLKKKKEDYYTIVSFIYSNVKEKGNILQ